MPKFDFYPSFNAGEVSPLIDARTSLEKYRSACRTLENFQILPYGGVLRRPGTQYLGEVKNSANQTRLIGFNFSTTTRFVIEMGVGYMRFWRPDGTRQTNASSNILEVTTPYTAADLREIQYVQINDIMYFAHANYPVYKLSRLADNNWTFAVVDWTFPPQLDQNEDNVTIKSLNDAVSTTLTASSPIFKSGHVGTRWDLKWKRTTASREINITANSVTPLLDVKGAWDFNTFGTWNATVRIMRLPNEKFKSLGGDRVASLSRSGTIATASHNNHGYKIGDIIQFPSAPAPFFNNDSSVTILPTGFTENSYQFTVANSGATSAAQNWVNNLSQMELVREYDSNADRNVVTSGNEAERCGLLIWILNYTAPSVAPTLTPRALLQANNNVVGGIVKIDSVAANGLTANATITEWLGEQSYNDTTTLWTEPAFSGERGYPRTVALHEQRLVFGGTSYQPNTIWGSRIDDFENFQTGSTASDAINFTLSASEGNRINWMYSQARLLVGTSGDEWTIGSADTSQSLSATNVQAQRQSSYGSKYMRGALVNDVLLFVQRNGRKVRELVYDLNKDGWVAPDLTLLAEHITVGEIMEIAYQQQPDAVLWAVRGDGSLIAMTYERDQKVVGWHRHNFGDADVESVATIYGNGTEDEIWMVMKRYRGIVAGMRVQFTNLPAGSGLSASETYIVSQNTSGNSFYIRNRNYEPIAFSNSSITANTTQITVVGGNFSAPITSLNSGVLTYSGVAPGTTRTVERFPLLWRNYFDEENANQYRYLDCNSEIMTGVGPFTTTVTGLSHLEGKTVTVVQGSNVVTRTVNSGSITAPSTNSGYIGLPYTSTLTPMKLDAEFDDGTAQGRKKRIHQIVVRTLKSRGGQVRTNNGEWYNLASTTTTGDQKMILAGAFGLDADVTLRQTDPYPMCVLAITPKWDAYGNE